MPAPHFSKNYKSYALAVMTGVYMLNLVDRGLMMLLLQPIKEDLGLSDTQLGLVTGIAFGLFYATLGVPIARWADRGDRVTIASLAIGLWGLTVMASLWITNYAQLVLARVAAAVGESGCKPPTYSLVGDYFPAPGERTRAMAIYLTGNALSSLVAFMLGGWLAEHYGWRATFFIMGTLGIGLAVLVRLTIKEPRASNRAAAISPTPSPPLRQIMLTLWHQRSLRHITMALTLLYTMSLGLGPWYAAFLMRSHHLSAGELGLYLGFIFSGAGIAGLLLGGYAATAWFGKSERRQMLLSAISIASVVPLFIAFLFASNSYHALAALAGMMLVLSVFLGPTYALMQRLVRDDMRATMMATVMLISNLVGFGAGPQLVGFLSDLLASEFGQDSLRYAMLSMAIIGLWASFHYWRAADSIEPDLRTMAQAIPASPS